MACSCRCVFTISSRFPVGSRFTVGSSGLFGDRFVAVWMPPAGEPKRLHPQERVIEGTRETGMDDLTREGGELVKDLRGHGAEHQQHRDAPERAERFPKRTWTI